MIDAPLPLRHTITSPLGPITLEVEGDYLVGLTIHPDAEVLSETPGAPAHPVLAQARRELNEYFSGVRTSFETPVRVRGTAFQEDIWSALQHINWGHTESYRSLGEKAGHRHASRAVGGAVGANPIPIIIPCHRVVGATGAITGYSGGNGISTKKILLDLEKIPYRA